VSKSLDDSLWRLTGRFVRCLRKSHSLREIEIVPRQAPRKVLVLAPHADDETVGAGGALYNHHVAGDSITLLVMTDGATCSKANDYQDIIHVRRQEILQVQAILGLTEVIFWTCQDGNLATCHGAGKKLTGMLEDVGPDVVYLPFVIDKHPDHVAANRLFAFAFKESGIDDCEVRAYEGSFPLTLKTANTYIDITDAIERKALALACYESQTIAFGCRLPYNRKLSYMLSSEIRYLETFFSCWADRYCAFVLEAPLRTGEYLLPIALCPSLTIIPYLWNLVVRRGAIC